MMTEQENREFDIMLKSILENATEEVPPQLWEGISAKVEAGQKRKALLLWLRRAGTAAAAAAVLIAVILSIRLAESPVIEPASHIAEAPIEIIKEEHPAIAQSLDSPISNEAKTGKNASYSGHHPVYSQAAGQEQAEASGKADDSATNQDFNKADNPVAESQIVTVQETEEAPVCTIPEENSKFEDYDIFGGLEEDDEVEKVTTAVELSGLAAGNTANASNRPGSIPWKGQSSVRDRISETGESTFAIPVSLGIGVKIMFTPRWALGTGVSYSILNRTFPGTYIDENGQSQSFSDIRNIQHYIGIPINAYFSIISKDFVDFYAYAGGSVEKCVSNKFRMLGTPTTYSEKVPGVQLSANIGLGAEFIVAKRLGIFIDPSLRYYFRCEQPKSIRTQQPLTFGVQAGLRVRL